MKLGLVASLLLAVAAIALGCGDSSETLTVDEYFWEIDAIFSAIDADVDAQQEQERPILDDMNEDVEAFLADETNLAVLKILITYSPRIRILGDAIERLNALEPPPEAEEAHYDLIDAGEDLSAAFGEQSDIVQGVETIAELLALEIDLSAARGAFTEACLGLVAVGRDSGITVAVGCGSII